MYNQDALQQAMTKLKGSGLKMWLYINKNQDNYRFELSRKACEDWGIKKDSYYDGFNDLVNHGYLRLSKEGSNVYHFFENALAENPTSGYSEFYFTGDAPNSFLSTPGALEVGMEINSLSKSFSLAGTRIAYIAGNEEMINIMKQLKSNLDFGIYGPIQEAGIVVLNHAEEITDRLRKIFSERYHFLENIGNFFLDLFLIFCIIFFNRNKGSLGL